METVKIILDVGIIIADSIIIYMIWKHRRKGGY